MKKIALLLLAPLILTVVKPPPALAARPGRQVTGNWENVKSLATGDLIEVRIRDGKGRKGNLATATDVALTLTDGRRTLELRREEVERVVVIGSTSKGKSTLIGMAGVRRRGPPSAACFPWATNRRAARPGCR